MFPSKVNVARSVPAQPDLLGPLYGRILNELQTRKGGWEVGQLAPSDDAVALLGALPVAIYMTDAEGRIVFYNPAARNIWGRDPDPELDRWCGAYRLYTKDGLPLQRADCAMATIVLTGELALGEEQIAERSDGSRVSFVPLPNLLRDREGRITGAINMLVELTAWNAANAEMHAAEDRYRLAVEAAGDVVWDNNLVSGVITYNDALEDRFGYAPDPAQSSLDWWIDRVHPDDSARVMHEANQALADNVTSFVSEYRFRRADGRYAAVLARSSIVRNADGLAVRAIGALLDLSERKQAEEALRVSEERLRLAARASGLGIADYDLVTGDVHWSPELREMVGMPADGPISWDMVRQLLDPENEQDAFADHESAVRGERGHTFSGTYLVTRPSDNAKRWHATSTSPIYNDERTAVRLITTVRDVTNEKTAQDRINWIATHDSITGLPNRHAFQIELDASVERAREKGEALNLILIDLDNFKYVNDTLGHEAGDATLSAFADRLSKVIPSSATAARFGGDEFAVIVPRPATEASVDVSAAIQKALQAPFAIAGRSIILRTSIGVSIFPAHGEVASDLVKNADMALYSAKALGRSNVRTFEPSLRSVLQREVLMLSQARAAVSNGWIEPHYQPKIELGTGQVVGFEALLRWRHPATGLQPPTSIASAFDDAELSGMIGEAMIETVLQDLRRWQASGVPVSKIAINASAAEFADRGYAEHLLSRLAVHGIDPSAIEVEITETALLSDRVDIVLSELMALRDAGVTVALDDFGTGFSSLSHLRQFPVDKLKVDRSFVAGIGENEGDGAIVEAVVRLGRALGMEIIAEGVEKREQAEFLTTIGCQTAQGFFYSPALPAEDVAAFIAAGPHGGCERPGAVGRAVE